jgi:hypothetical protein
MLQTQQNPAAEHLKNLIRKAAINFSVTEIALFTPVPFDALNTKPKCL